MFLALGAPAAEPRKFYDDDPLWKMPKPVDAGKPVARKLSEYYDFFWMTFGQPGEKHTEAQRIPALGVNTLGEVPDSDWYTNRHARKRMTREELLRGPGNTNSPSTAGHWKITAAKTEGVTPGFTIEDSNGRRYLLKFDSRLNHELGSGADVMGSKFFYALGYNVPENYIVYFNAEQLTVDPAACFIDYRGVERNMRQADIEKILADVPRNERGQYRAIASLFLEGKPLGPFRYLGVRTDDPNDIFPHEHRRDLRGLQVFASWLNHTDSKSLNSLDMLVKQGDVAVIKHHLIDFSASFGADAFVPKSPRNGNEYLFSWSESARNFFTLGLYVPRWARADYKHVKGIGRIESDVFQPEDWKSNYYNPAFINCLPDDGFWAAKQVMAFTDEDIRLLVGTGQFSDKEGVEYLIQTLIERRDKIGREWFRAVLPLDEFRIEDGRLAFDDLGARYGFNAPRPYTFTWSQFNNHSGEKTPIANAGSAALPANSGEYVAVEIRSNDSRQSVTVYLKKAADAWRVVGLDR